MVQPFLGKMNFYLPKLKPKILLKLKIEVKVNLLVEVKILNAFFPNTWLINPCLLCVSNHIIA